MSEAIAVMRRHELKYIIDQNQTDFLIDALKDYMKIDKYGKTSVASIYYDTTDSRLIRTSLERPNFKEKIRLRAYNFPVDNNHVFLEVKRKADGVVYKRRVETTTSNVESFFDYKMDLLKQNQIAKEIAYFRNYYGKLIPKCVIIYDRIAYDMENSDLRVTFDFNPRYRLDHLSLDYSSDGIPLLDNGLAILEIKAQDAIPLWLSHLLDKGKIYKNSFSKYGKVYENSINLGKESSNYV